MRRAEDARFFVIAQRKPHKQMLMSDKLKTLLFFFATYMIYNRVAMMTVEITHSPVEINR